MIDEDEFMSENEEFFDAPEEEEEEEEEEMEENTKTEDELEKLRASRKEQKQKAVERKLQKPHADIILQAKKLWEEVRQKRLSKAERKKLMDEMMSIVSGKALDVTIVLIF
jgi:hypothetical protein